MSGDSRAAVHDVQDVIMLDSDFRNNSSTPSIRPPPQVVIGEPKKGYNIHQSMK